MVLECRAPKHPGQCGVEVRETIAHGLHRHGRAAPAEGLVQRQPDALALHFEDAEVGRVFFPVVGPEPGFLDGGGSLGAVHPHGHCQSAHHGQHGRQSGQQLLFPQGSMDLFQRGVGLRIGLHRDWQADAVQFVPAGRAALQMLFDELAGLRAGEVFGVEGEQVPDEFTGQFHEYDLLFSCPFTSITPQRRKYYKNLRNYFCFTRFHARMLRRWFGTAARGSRSCCPV